jgi:hypothetical protein
MTDTEKKIVAAFRESLERKFRVSDVIVFGSRARGDADEYSDLDVVAVLDEELDDSIRDYVSDCAWHAGFEQGIVVVPVLFSRRAWQTGAVRDSLLARAIEMEGQTI